MNEAKSILVAEDDDNDVELTLFALEEHRLAHRVELVRDGQEALDYLFCRGKFVGRRGGNPAVVLLDVKMPKVSGLEVLHQIKTTEHLKRIPVVLFTSSREPGDVKQGYDNGANAYVVKPFGLSEFTDALRRVGVFWTAINEVPSAA